MAENIDSVTQFRIGAAISTRKKARALDDDAAQSVAIPIFSTWDPIFPKHNVIMSINFEGEGSGTMGSDWPTWVFWGQNRPIFAS